MSEPKDGRSRTTALYIVLSALVLVVGIGLTVWGGQDVPLTWDAAGKVTSTVQRSLSAFSVGTSLLAAGLASLGFAVVRVFDDRDAARLTTDMSALANRVEGVNNTLREARKLIRRTQIVIPSARDRCLFDPQISGRFREAIGDCDPNGALHVDVVGLKLHRFLTDQLQHLTNHAMSRQVIVRMLLQDPDSADFGSICQMEARDEKGTRGDILAALRLLKGGTHVGDDLVYSKGHLTISVRFYPWFQPIAFFRVGGTILVRPRIRSAGAGDRFYEAYSQDEGEEHFGLYRDHFNNCWTKARFVVPSTIASGMQGLFTSK